MGRAGQALPRDRQEANADVFLSPRVNIDKTTDKLNAIQFRKPGGPHPLVSKSEVVRAQTILYECMEAQLAFRAAEKTSTNFAAREKPEISGHNETQEHKEL